MTKFVAYLVHVHRNNLWDCRDVQGCDGTCPTQFRPQLWYFSHDSEVDDIEKEDNRKAVDDVEDNKLVQSPENGFENGGTTTPAMTSVGIEEMDYIARFEDLQGAYQTITRTLSIRHQTSSSSSSSQSHPSDTQQVISSVVKTVVPYASPCPGSTNPCTVFVCTSDSGSINASDDSTGGSGMDGTNDNGGCDDRIKSQNGASTGISSSGNDGSSSSANSSSGSGSGSSSSDGISGSSISAHWPAELPHTRASLHPPELPDCFQGMCNQTIL